MSRPEPPSRSARASTAGSTGAVGWVSSPYTRSSGHGELRVVVVVGVDRHPVGEGRETRRHPELGTQDGALAFAAGAKVLQIIDDDMAAFSHRTRDGEFEAVDD